MPIITIYLFCFLCCEPIWRHKSINNQIINQAGFIYIYLSNESASSNYVFFDNLDVAISESPVLETTDYYPFGLTFNSYEKPGTIQQKFKYNDGAEREDAFDLGIDFTAFRSYDPSIGRLWQTDMVHKYHESPYAWVTNNPIRFNDPLGLDTLQNVDVVAPRINSNNALIPGDYILPDLKPKNPKILEPGPAISAAAIGAGVLTVILVAKPTSMGTSDAWTQEDMQELDRLLGKKSTGTLTKQDERELNALMEKAVKFNRVPWNGLKKFSNNILADVKLIQQLQGKGQLKDLRNNPNLRGVDIEDLLQKTPREIEEELRGVEGGSKTIKQINKAFEGRDLGLKGRKN